MTTTILRGKYVFAGPDGSGGWRVISDGALFQRDGVIADMLARLGAVVTEVSEPFMPEGGAYGMGRTHGHDHSHVHVHVGHGPHEDDDEDDDAL